MDARDQHGHEGVRHFRSPELAAIGALSALIVIAFTLRLIPVLFVPSVNWADEIFQSTEQAHRLVYGTGLVPWEFQLGIRSWLLPGVIAGLMEFARNFGDGPDYYFPVIAGAWGLLAVVPVVCCFVWCKRWFGLPAAIVGGLCVAVAPELVYMGDRTLTEVLAAHLLVLALYLLDPGYRVVAFPRLVLAGATLGLGLVLRVQLAPAIGLIAVWTTTRSRWTNFLAVMVGGSVVLGLAALLDAVTLGSPLASVWRYVLYNSYFGVSSTFGIAPWYSYALAELAIWGYGLSVVLILAVLATRRTVLPLVAALVIIAAHSCIGHKEYRFIYPAIVLLAVQAGIGLAGLVEWAREQLGGFRRWRMLARHAVPVLAAGLWCTLSLTVWTGPVLAAFRHRSHDYILAASFVAHDTPSCGIGMYGADAWSWFGGYSYLHRPVPMYWPNNGAALERLAPAFNVLLYSTGFGSPEPVIPTGFAKQRCFGEACIARRAGQCATAAPTPMPFPAPLAGLAPHR